MACRFPGGANSPSAFWELLRNGVDAITEIPPERWNASRFYHPNPAAPGRMVTRWGGFVGNVDAFDATFFGISPREASRIAPQQRWLLETAWEAIEDAGMPPEQLAGSRTGVFIGISHPDYPMLHRRNAMGMDGYTNLGNALSVAANRLSYLLDFRGPSLAIDTACSSSLVALHLAVRSLQSGECDYAIVGGANELLSPELTIGFSHAHMLSPRGRCRAFDAGADGYVRAEGAGAVLLMPLTIAQTLGLSPRALIIATASNQDGRSSSLTVPNQAAQEAMMREGLLSAKVDADEIVYVEAHGTGTTVGDRIEVSALAAVLAKDRAGDTPLLVGSVKTNVGHMEPASGIAGLIKSVLVLEHQAVPPHLHLEHPNPQLSLQGIEIPTVLTRLPASNGRNGHGGLVGVNSFGFGGTNAHALLGPASVADVPAGDGADNAPDFSIFPFSAGSAEALAEYAESYANVIEKQSAPSFSLQELCAAAALGKSQHPIRSAVVADSLADLQTQLTKFRGSVKSQATPEGPFKVAFVFSGQNAQSCSMGRRLYRREKNVREMWERCDAVCRKLGGPNLLEELLADEAGSRLTRTEVVQPVLFALQASVTELWRSWGIQPDMVLGHSVGEAATAWASGAYSLEQIFRVVLGRSRLQALRRGLGRMLAVSLSTEDALRWVNKYPGRVDVAAFNAPGQLVLSGESAALEELAAALKRERIFRIFLPTEHAFHSVQMDTLKDPLLEELAGITGGSMTVPMISTVTGKVVQGAELNDEYWWKNVRQPVQFSAAAATAMQAGCTAFIEIGAHPTLAPALAETALAQKRSIVSIPSLRRGEDERRTMLQGLATLYRCGASVRWSALFTRPARALRLPAYPWQRQRLWQESPDAERELRRPPPHPLLGDRQPSPEPTWHNQLDARLLPWLADHRLSGSTVLPAAAYIEMAAAAVRELLSEPTILLEDVRFHRVLFLPDERLVSTSVRLDPTTTTFQIFAAPPDSPYAWELHAEGVYRSGRLRVPPAADLKLLREECTQERNVGAVYQEFASLGQVYGPAFQGLSALQVSEEEAALGTIVTPSAFAPGEYSLFPPTLDACFQAGVALRGGSDRRAFVVTAAREVRVFQPLPGKVWSHVRLRERGENAHLADVTLLDEDGVVMAQLQGVRLLAINAESKAGQRERNYYQFGWEAAALSTNGSRERTDAVLVFADRGELSTLLIDALRARQVETVVVFDDAQPASHGALAVDLRQPHWARDLWQALASRGRIPSRVLHLWSCEMEESCADFLALTQARLAFPNSDQPARWLIVTRNAQAVDDSEAPEPGRATLWGFTRTIQTEQPQWQMSLVDIHDAESGDALVEELFVAEVEPELALRATTRYVRRLRQVQPRGETRSGRRPPAYALQISQPGRVDSLGFRGQARTAPKPGEVEVEVAAAGLNFRDLMKALGIYPSPDHQPTTLGDEFAGTVARVGRGVRGLRPGDRVMGFASTGGAFASHLHLRADVAWKAPAHLSLAEAASIPVVFGTAYHALHNLARLRRGETILIHAAAGGVGLAALQLAQKIGAVVLATAGSEEKRDLLRSLGAALVMDSRTLDFADEVMRYTQARGVDVVLNSLAGAFQQKSLAVCAPHGRFVEIGKRDLFENRPLPLAAFQRSLSFFAFDLASVFASNGEESRALRRFFSTGFKAGGLRPIARTTIPAADAVSAFRLMQTAQHIGKIVLEFDADRAPKIPAEFWPNPHGTYLISGGLSGLGLATARWLVERGAQHVALLSRRGVASAKDALILEAMRARGVTIATFAADVGDGKALARVLRRFKNSAHPLCGVFHSAMVLRDRLLPDLTPEDLAAVLAPKAAGAWSLHEQTRDLPLDCFVMFSSISSWIGTPGQANYAAANAFLDALAHRRRAEGLPALTVNWGHLGDTGIAAEQAEIGRYLEAMGVHAIPSTDALATLPRLIASSESQVGVMDVDWAKLARASVKFGASPIFRDLAESGESAGRAGTANWRETMLELPAEERAAAVVEFVIAQVAATLGTAPADLDPAGPLNGMDSLMAVELKVRIEEHSGCVLPMDGLSAEVTVARLAERLLNQISASDPNATLKPVSAVSGTRSGPGQIAAPLLRVERVPLMEVIRSGELQPLTAAALMPWPITLFEQSGVAPETVFQQLNGGRVTLDLILQTALGPVGIFMLPLTTAQVNTREASLMPLALEGIRHASAAGARCVALTSLIPSATNYGATIQAACEAERNLAPVTTGHATTVAAVILNLVALLDAAGASSGGGDGHVLRRRVHWAGRPPSHAGRAPSSRRTAALRPLPDRLLLFAIGGNSTSRTQLPWNHPSGRSGREQGCGCLQRQRDHRRDECGKRPRCSATRTRDPGGR
jgi:acyl transferase domain-containing protein/NADP-dependent 3-hydroxy acid dehydrogenase YdfG/acyl carrier protein